MYLLFRGCLLIITDCKSFVYAKVSFISRSFMEIRDLSYITRLVPRNIFLTVFSFLVFAVRDLECL